MAVPTNRGTAKINNTYFGGLENGCQWNINWLFGWIWTQYKKASTRGSSFTARMGENVVTDTNKQTLENQSYNRKVNQTTPMDAYLATAVQECNEILSLEDMLPMETERYLIRNASDMEGVPAYAIYDKELGKYAYIREDQLAIQKDAASGFSFVIDMSQPFSCNVRVTDELRGLLSDWQRREILTAGSAFAGKTNRQP